MTKKKVRIYISGPITGIENYKQKFKDAAKEAVKKFKKEGVEVIIYDPADKIGAIDGMDYEDCLAVDFAFIDCCDIIFLMKDWEKSKGAKRECWYAMAKQKVLFLAENDFMLTPDWYTNKLGYSFKVEK